MKGAEPPALSDSEMERQAVAELLGRILAAHWLANCRRANKLPIHSASAQAPLTASTVEAYDGQS